MSSMVVRYKCSYCNKELKTEKGITHHRKLSEAMKGKQMGRAMLKELISILEQAGHKQIIMLSKHELKVVIATLKSYDDLLKRLDGDWKTEEKE